MLGRVLNSKQSKCHLPKKTFETIDSKPLESDMFLKGKREATKWGSTNMNWIDKNMGSREVQSSLFTQEQRKALLGFISQPMLLSHHPSIHYFGGFSTPWIFFLQTPGSPEAYPPISVPLHCLRIHLCGMSVLRPAQQINTRTQLFHTTPSREEGLPEAALLYHEACNASKLGKTPSGCS